ncbi:MAG: hypothetical protein HeimC3_17200 [Candidatus Heimdallarchaeota archaeon LC_3]|nr:MAG: hypothetical protein HeimC3_17200 [Candidatus Heimdallarchaeota archaeon LC_3]
MYQCLNLFKLSFHLLSKYFEVNKLVYDYNTLKIDEFNIKQHSPRISINFIYNTTKNYLLLLISSISLMILGMLFIDVYWAIFIGFLFGILYLIFPFAYLLLKSYKYPVYTFNFLSRFFLFLPFSAVLILIIGFLVSPDRDNYYMVIVVIGTIIFI